MKVRNYISFGLRCSHCGSFQKKHINIFDGSGKDEKAVLCSACRRRICTVERDGRNYKIETSCAFCGDKHKYILPVSEVLHIPKKRLVCKATRATSMIIGRDKYIESFMKSELENEIKPAVYDERSEAAAIFDTVSMAGGAFENVNELYECLEHFKNLSADGRVGCECGESMIQLQVEEDGFRVICSTCGRDMFFDFTDREGIEYIRNISEIYLT